MEFGTDPPLPRFQIIHLDYGLVTSRENPGFWSRCRCWHGRASGNLSKSVMINGLSLYPNTDSVRRLNRLRKANGCYCGCSAILPVANSRRSEGERGEWVTCSPPISTSVGSVCGTVGPCWFRNRTVPGSNPEADTQVTA